ncbi:hypothetical protein HDU67_001608 [Dinochytrium kinnereticum]|nr:hypothetical protein HDU67_001608 [Dinochytrium kinnereticum]
MSLSVEIAPIEGETDFVVGFPCVGPVTVKGVCRISNIGTAAINLNFLEILLNGESGGSLPNGGTVEAMSLLFARQVLVVTEHPAIPISCSTFLDLPFQFEFTRENAALLPPSSCISRDYMEAYVKYELRVSWKESGKGETESLTRSFSRTSDAFVFRYPRFDLDDLIQYFYGKSTKGVSGRSDDNTVKFNLVLPNSLIPDDVFKFEYAVVSTEPKNAIKAVHLQIWERLALETVDGKDVDKHDLVFIYSGEPANPNEPALELKRKVLLRAPKWITSSQPITDVSVITPSVFSGSVKISHFMRVLLEVQSGLSVTIDSDVNVIPVTRSLLSDLASKSGALKGSNDPKAAKLAVALESLGPSIDTAVSMNRNLMSEDEELAFALQASMKATAAEPKFQDNDEDLKRVLQLSIADSGRSSGSGSYTQPTIDPRTGAPAPPPRAASKVTTINGVVPEDEAFRLAIEQSQADPLTMAEEEAIRLAILESKIDSELLDIVREHDTKESTQYGNSTVSVMSIDAPIRSRNEDASESSTMEEPGLKRGPGFFTIVGNKFESAISSLVPTTEEESTSSSDTPSKEVQSPGSYGSPVHPQIQALRAPPRTAVKARETPPPQAQPQPSSSPPIGISIKTVKKVPFSQLIEEYSSSTSSKTSSSSDPISSSNLAPHRPIIEPRLSSRLSKRDGFRAAKAPSAAPAVSVQLHQTSGGKLVIQPRMASVPRAEDGRPERHLVLFDYSPNKPDEISLRKGAIVVVVKKYMDGG